MIRRITSALSVAVVAVALAGCTASASLTVPASTVEDQAAKALQEQVGSDTPPEMDCGEDAVPLKEGTEVPCVLTDPASGSKYDSTVTLSDIDGTKYHIDVQVASTPKE